MERVAIGLLAATLALAGCATAPDVPQPAAAQVAAANAHEEEMAVTGSRLVKRKSTDRMVKTVGAQDARDNMDSTPNTMNSQ